MSLRRPSSRPRRRLPATDAPSRPASAPPGELPPNFPESAPLSDDGLEAAKKEAASPMKLAANDLDPGESLVPDTDPLQRRRDKLEEHGKG